MGAYLALPAGDAKQEGPAPAIIVIQEIFGINADMRHKCDALAAQGYIAIAPDLFWRQEPGIELTDKSEAEWQKAFALYNGFDVAKGVQDLLATHAYIKNHPRSNGHVGAVGYCLGGKLAFLLGCAAPVPAVSYYGVGLDGDLDKTTNIASPMLLHIAGQDKFVPKAAQQKIMAAFAASALVKCHLYENQDHAFAREQGEHYDAAAATQANQRTADFFKQHLQQK